MGGGQSQWPTTPPPHRPLGAGDPGEAGPYRLEAVLGAGGMGRVYLGRTPAGSAVAVKVVHREYASDRAFRKRFEQEVAAARRVQGLYTVPVVDADLRADEPWLATAYVPGPSLHDAVAEGGPLPVDAAVGLIARVAEALQSIHAADVIHRDLKPSNIILTAEGPKVIDFGIARAADVTSVTGTGMLTGTPAYMAPEYIRGQAVTEAVDVFALGVVACFAATGRPAFGGGSHHAVTYRILEQAPDLDDCPEPVRTIAAYCLEKDPRRRPTPAEVIRHCHPAAPAAPAGATGGEGHTAPGHTAPSLPRARTVVGSAPGLHDALTAPAAPGGPAVAPGRPDGPAGPASPASPHRPDSPDPLSSPAPDSPDPLNTPDSHAAPAPRLSVLLGGLGLLALAVVLIAVLLPGQSADRDTPSSLEPVATLARFAHPGTDVAVAFSPDGKTLASGGDGKVELWDVAGRKRRATLTQRVTSGTTVFGIPCLAFSPDGKLLAVCTDRGELRLWDVAERRQVARIPGDPIRAVKSVAFSPDGKVLATGGGDGARLWEVNGDGGRLEQLAVLVDETSIKRVAFSPNGKTLATAGVSYELSPDGDHSVQLWDVSSRKARKTLNQSKELWGMAFSPDGKTLVTTGKDNMMRLWDVAGGLQKDSLVDENVVELRDVAFSPDGTTLAVASGARVGLWDVADRHERTRLISGHENVAGLAFSSDGRYLATTGYDGKTRLWKVP
ncbi:WD40 repeat domain-containing serine/threonine protein kinase [Streptomyces sparsogenes]|uniref:WD40 repeat domain-containing serine/threonine protein kinase n=1 Tax=Streptomyces sparsogenes TaxID=67365 RepID=UPI000825E8B4|nr:serine/threonine-protein kinase [Streptomyces sparsogenes]